jgi:hypothetical protein
VCSYLALKVTSMLPACKETRRAPGVQLHDEAQLGS